MNMNHLLFFGGRKEANHLHCLLQPFEVMSQVFLVFDLKVLLQDKARQTVSRVV